MTVPPGGPAASYREGLVVLGQRLTVLEGVDGDHLVAPAVDVLQPQQEAVAGLVEVLGRGHTKWEELH